MKTKWRALTVMVLLTMVKTAFAQETIHTSRLCSKNSEVTFSNQIELDPVQWTISGKVMEVLNGMTMMVQEKICQDVESIANENQVDDLNKDGEAMKSSLSD